MEQSNFLPSEAISGTIDRYETDQTLVADGEDVAMKEKKNSDDATGKIKKKNRAPARAPAPIKEALTTVAHICVVAFVLLICYLCFAHPFVFFTWHPLLLSIGWMLLMSEAILTISKENLLTRKLKVTHDGRILAHWVIFAIAAVLIAAGFFVVVINKNSLNKNHFTSWHGLLGLIGVIAYIPPCLNGVALYYNKDLKQFVKPKIVKFMHVVSGTAAFACGGTSLILSVYTKWFTRNTDNNKYLFWLGLVFATFPIVWTVQRPLIKCVKIVYNKFEK